MFERGAVRIETDGRRVLAHRLDPRSDLRSLRHRLWWDELDLLYFSGSALWTYMATPFIFATPGFEIDELEPWDQSGEVWRRLGGPGHPTTTRARSAFSMSISTRRRSS